MRVYLAGVFVEKDTMPRMAAAIEAAGHSITHKWWEVESKPYGERTDAEKCEQAMLDVSGVRNADAIILINSSKSEGKAVEQGIAIAKGIPIFAVGTKGEHSKNIFHWLPNYRWYNRFEDALLGLAVLQAGHKLWTDCRTVVNV